MKITLPQVHDRVVVDREHLQDLFLTLSRKGYQVVGPTIRDHAIVYDTLTSVADLPVGYTGENFSTGIGLTSKVERAAQKVVEHVCGEVQNALK